MLSGYVALIHKIVQTSALLLHIFLRLAGGAREAASGYKSATLKVTTFKAINNEPNVIYCLHSSDSVRVFQLDLNVVCSIELIIFQF